jgi:hypothetical protein
MSGTVMILELIISSVLDWLRLVKVDKGQYQVKYKG